MHDANRPLSARSTQDMDLRELLGVMRGGWRLFAAILAGTLALAAAYVLLAPPVYQGDAMVQVEPDQKGLDAMFGDVAELLGAQTPVAGELEILRSRLVLDAVIDQLGLEIVAQPRYLPLAGAALARWRAGDEPGLAGGPAPFAWGGEALALDRLDVPRALLDRWLTLRAVDGGYELRDADGTLLAAGAPGETKEVARGSGRVVVAVRELRAAPGTEFRVMRRNRDDVLRDLAEALDVAERGKQSGVIGIAYEDRDPARAAAVINTLLRAYLRQNVDRHAAEAAQTLAFVDAQLPKVKEALEAAEAALNGLRLRRGSVDLTKETELVLQESVDLESQRMQLEQNRQALLQRFTATHPALQAVAAQLRELAREQAAVLARVKNLPESQQELLRLSRDVEVNNATYTMLLNNAQQLQLAKAGTVGNVRVIDYAREPGKPVRPRPALVLGLAALLGVAAGLLAVFLRRALTEGVEDPAVIERTLGLPTYAAIPFARSQRRLARAARGGALPLLAVSEPGDPAVEALRSLRTSLHFALAESKSNVIVLTGPTPELGKSFVAMNLAAVLSTARKSVVVVDADLRRGRLHEHAGLPRAPGLSDYVAGHATAEDVVQRTAIAGLHLVPTGTLPPNPAELLLHERMAALLAELSRRFDHVLIDTPPVLAVTDASLIARLAGSTLLVLKAGAHTLRSIEEAVRRLTQAGVEVRGSIFNQVGRAGSAYAYDYAYEYRAEGSRRSA